MFPKINSISVVLLAFSLSVLSSCAPKENSGKDILEKAYQVHGAEAIDRISTIEVVRATQNELNEFSLLTQRLDFAKKIDFFQQNVLSSAKRGVIFQRVITDTSGKFWYYDRGWTGSNKITEMEKGWVSDARGDFLKSVLITRFLSQLTDLKSLDKRTIAGNEYQLLSYKYFGSGGTIFFDKEGRFAGSQYVETRGGEETKKIDTICGKYETKEGILFPTTCVDYDQDGEIINHTKFTSVKINPTFKPEDFALKVAKPDTRTGANPFGMVLSPADTEEVQGLRVVPAPLRNPALAAGLDYGDEIIAINGKQVGGQDFVTLESIFWDENLKKVVLNVKKKSGKSATYTVVRP